MTPFGHSRSTESGGRPGVKLDIVWPRLHQLQSTLLIATADIMTIRE